MNLKVNNCGECPFKMFDLTFIEYYCHHPEISDDNDTLISDESWILPDCPEGGAFEIKTSPITIKIEEKK